MVTPLRQLLVGCGLRIFILMEVFIHILEAVWTLIIFLKLIELIKLVVQELQPIYVLRLDDQRSLCDLLWVHYLVDFVGPCTPALRSLTSSRTSTPSHW